jgi:aminoglycoside phosphotransferase (APT) family kinase protein
MAQRILTDLEVSGNATINGVAEINGVVVDPSGATNLMVLTYLAAQQKFVARAPSGGAGGGSGADEGTVAMISSWMMGSN